MNSAVCRWILVVVAISAYLTSASFAQSTPASPEPVDSWKKESFQWFEPIGPGGTVRVVNPHGAVYARFGGYEDEVEILATAQRIDKGLAPLEVRRLGSDGDLDVTVAVASSDSAVSTAERQDRIDLVVFVPKGATLDARTEADRIEIKGLKGAVSARTTRGDIWMRSVEGPVSAESSRGNVSVALETGVTERSQKISTVTGEIEVHLWEDARATVHVATSGEISTDFSIEIEHRRFEEPGKHGTAKIGGGGPELTLASKRGRVRLLRLPRHFKSEKQDEH